MAIKKKDPAFSRGDSRTVEDLADTASSTRHPAQKTHKKPVAVKKTPHPEPGKKGIRSRRPRSGADQSKDKYLDLYDFAPVGYFTLDGKGTILEVNLTGAEILARPRTALINQNLIPFLTPESYPFFNKFLVTTRETGEKHVCELELSKTDSSPARFIRIEGTAWLNKSRDLDRILVAISDITAQKKIEAQLIESEEWYRRLFETAQDAILIIDGDTGKVTNANKFFLDLLGYPPEYFIGNYVWELGPLKDKILTFVTFVELKKNRYIRFDDLALETRQGPIIRVEATGNVYLVGDKRIIQFNIRDITDRKEAQDLLLASENRYRRLFETARDGLLIIDEETGKVIDANPYLVDLLGYPLEYFIGRYFWDLGFIKENFSIRDVFSTLKTNGYIHFDDLLLETKDGHDVNVEVIGNVYAVNFHKIIQCNIRDITIRKQAENALRETKEYLENLIGYANAPIVVWDPRFEITEFNHAFEVLTGLKREEVLGKSLSLLAPMESREKYMDLIRQTLGGERLETVEIPILDVFGNIHIVLWNSANVQDSGGNIIATIAQGQEITKRKEAENALRESEQRFRNLVKRAPIPLCFVTKDGVASYLNDRFIQTFGYTLNDIPTMAEWWVRAYPDETYRKQVMATWEADVKQAAVEHTDIHPREYSVTCRDGTRHIVIISGITIDDNFLATFIDITHRKRMEEALQAANTKLNLLNNITRNDMLDEIRALQAFLKLSHNLPMSPVLTGYLEQCNQVTENLERQVSFTLDYQGMGAKVPAWQNISQTIHAATARFPMGKVTITEIKTGVEIFTDPLFENVVFNLIDNAFRYGGNTLRTITFSCSESDFGLVMTCEDDGRGILQEDKKHLFERGFGKKKDFGLFLSREILSVNGISISETSGHGKGARFEITVPVGLYRITDE
jgi:PAS domain S-box-containing protein